MRGKTSAGAPEATEVADTPLKKGDVSHPFKKNQTPPTLEMKTEKL